MSSAKRWIVCGGCVWKRVVRVVVMDVRRILISGGREPGGRDVVGGGSFSLFVDWLEIVLVWEEDSPAVVCEVEGTVWEDSRGMGTEGIGKSSCTI
jgi:hypothetical protein